MRKRTVIRVVTFLSAGVVVLGALALTGYQKARALEYYARANTQHAFDELVTNMSELSTALEKSVYITDPALESALCTQIYARAVSAQMAMGVLPYSSQELEQTAGFVSKVGDYANVLSRTVASNSGYSDEELQNLKDLSETASIMSMNLQDLQTRILAGDVTMEEVYTAASDAGTGDGEAPLAGTTFESMESEFPEFPTLIYDGPFSDSMTSPTPVYLEGLEEIDEAQAIHVAAKFLNVGDEEITLQGECGGNIPSYCCATNMNGGEYTLSVTKQGGEIMSVLCSRLVGEAGFSVDSGLAMARDFIDGWGLEGLTESYHMVQNGVLLVNYEYVQDNVICYPDLVKVGIALDNGTLMSYDAKGYLSAHCKRDIEQPVISADEAQEKVSQDLSVQSRQLAIIPSDGGEERLCYEFVCETEEGQRYILYVNALTGDEEKILILLEDESGSLTI